MSKGIDHRRSSRRWTYYDAVLDKVHFEWPDPLGKDTEEDAKAECIKYLDRTFGEGEYHMRSFLKRE
jgi:2,3-bisphosphoglycerate-independent phosphoglycerate mutase